MIFSRNKSSGDAFSFSTYKNENFVPIQNASTNTETVLNDICLINYHISLQGRSASMQELRDLCTEILRGIHFQQP